MVLAVFAAVARGRDAFTAGNASDKLAIAADMCTTRLAASEAQFRLHNSAFGACCCRPLQALTRCLRFCPLVEAFFRGGACCDALHAGDVLSVVEGLLAAYLRERTLG